MNEHYIPRLAGTRKQTFQIGNRTINPSSGSVGDALVLQGDGSVQFASVGATADGFRVPHYAVLHSTDDALTDTAGYNIREWDTEIADTTNVVNPQTNGTFTIPKGTWSIDYHGSQMRNRQGWVRLYNVTDSTVETYGLIGFSTQNNNNFVTFTESLSTIITLTEAKQFRIESYTEITDGATGIVPATGDPVPSATLKLVELIAHASAELRTPKRFKLSERQVNNPIQAATGINTRDLNTTDYDTTNQTALSSKRFVLPAGTWYITAMALAYRVDQTYIQLYDITNDAPLLVGISGISNDTDGTSSTRHLSGVVTVTTDVTCELQHYVANGGSNSRLVIDDNDLGSDLFAQVMAHEMFVPASNGDWTVENSNASVDGVVQKLIFAHGTLVDNGNGEFEYTGSGSGGGSDLVVEDATQTLTGIPDTLVLDGGTLVESPTGTYTYTPTIGNGYRSPHRFKLEEIRPDDSQSFSSSNAMHARELNTTAYDTTGKTALALNRFTIPAGTWRIDAAATAYRVGRTFVELYSITDSAALMTGPLMLERDSATSSSYSHLSGVITLTQDTICEFRQYNSSTNGQETINDSNVGSAVFSYIVGEEIFSSIQTSDITIEDGDASLSGTPSKLIFAGDGLTDNQDGSYTYDPFSGDVEVNGTVTASEFLGHVGGGSSGNNASVNSTALYIYQNINTDWFLPQRYEWQHYDHFINIRGYFEPASSTGNTDNYKLSYIATHDGTFNNRVFFELDFLNDLVIANRDFQANGNAGFYGNSPVAQPTVSGGNANAVIQSIVDALSALGLINEGTITL